MNFNSLRYLVALAHERNFRRAAELCYVTQPALSLGIQKLEGNLGAILIERSKTDVQFTPLGEKMVEQAQKILEEVDKMRELVAGGGDPLSGELRLGAIHTVGPYLLPDLVISLKKRAPKMPLSVEENTTAQLTSALKQGRLDVIVVALPFNEPGLLTLPVYDESFVVAVPADHAWSKRRFIRTNELEQQRLLLLGSGHCFSDQVIDLCPPLNRQDREPVHGNSLETICNMVVSGLGITVLPCSAAKSRQQNRLFKIVPFHAPIPQRRIVLAWRKTFTRSLVITILKEAFGELRNECFQLIHH